MHALSVWNRYGDNGKGFAIGFNKIALVEPTSDYPLIDFRKVIYSNDKRSVFIHDNVNNTVKSILDRIQKAGWNDKRRNLHPDLRQIIADAFNNISSQLAFFKNNSFSDEQEVRLSFNRAMKSDQFPVKDEASMLHNLSFYKKYNIGLVPYLKLHISPECVSEIIVGPTNNTSISRLRLFLSVNGFDCSNIEIMKSETGYQ